MSAPTIKMLQKLINLLKEKKLTVALAESCSGGYTSYLLTKLPGSSKVFKGAIIVYSLESKNKFFKISASVLKKTCGVSEKIALILAKKVRKKFNTDIGAAIVGFAGPGGLQVGTFFIAVTTRNKIMADKLILKGSRDAIRKKASRLLIDLIYEIIHSNRFA